MHQYRCTRNTPYQDVDCPGSKDPRARQGHYVQAESPEEALKIMTLTFPKDTEGFTVGLWPPEPKTKT